MHPEHFSTNRFISVSNRFPAAGNTHTEKQIHTHTHRETHTQTHKLGLTQTLTHSQLRAGPLAGITDQPGQGEGHSIGH